MLLNTIMLPNCSRDSEVNSGKLHGKMGTKVRARPRARARALSLYLPPSLVRSPSLRCFLTVLHAAEQVFLCSAARHPPAPVIKARITQVYPA